MKVIFMRHGEGVDDIESRYGGWGDLPLSERGKKQAQERIESLRKFNIEKVLSSPLKRAMETADIVAKGLGLESEKWLYLKERNSYGLMSQEVKTDIENQYPELHKAYENNTFVMGSEREEDFISRIREMVRRVQHFELGVILGITHGVFLKFFCRELLGKELATKEDGCLLEVDIEGNTVTFVSADGLTFKKA